MGTLLVLILLAVAGWIVWKLVKKPDTNNDGVVDVKDVVAAAQEVATEVKAEATEVAVKTVEKAKKIRKTKVGK